MAFLIITHFLRITKPMLQTETWTVCSEHSYSTGCKPDLCTAKLKAEMQMGEMSLTSLVAQPPSTKGV